MKKKTRQGFSFILTVRNAHLEKNQLLYKTEKEEEKRGEKREGGRMKRWEDDETKSKKLLKKTIQATIGNESLCSATLTRNCRQTRHT